MNKHAWDNLKYVLAVVDAGSVNAAAKSLGVNHATILRRISSYEQNLGVELFEKHARGYRLRADVGQIIAAVRAVAEAVDTVERMAAGKDIGLHGNVRLTSTDSICNCILPTHLAAFAVAYPKILIEVNSTNSRLDLSKLDADISIRPTMRLPDNLTGIQVNRIDLRLFGSSRYLAWNSSAKAKDHHWLAPTGALQNSPAGRWFDTLPAERIVSRADSYLIMARQAQAGMGLAMMPVCIGDYWDGLIRAPFAFEFSVPVWIATHPDMLNSPHIRTTMQFFETALRTENRFRA